MNRFLLFLFFLTIFFPLTVSAQELNDFQKIGLNLEVSANFQFIPEKKDFFLEEVNAQLFLIPENIDYQTSPASKKLNDSLLFTWLSPKELNFSLKADFDIENQKRFPLVKKKIPFPLVVDKELDLYLKPDKIIDSDNPLIIKQASLLAEGEDDLFKVVFKIGDWVEKNIKYDLSTLTVEISQPASWVLKNRIGVCDEISILFIAMLRSLGIPAKFISGLSYSNTSLFEENWLSHGWVEVYFPGVGWLPFDLTFRQFGYLDATHLKFQENNPLAPSIKYSWKGKNLILKTEETKFKVKVNKKEGEEKPAYSIENFVFAPEVAFDSYNLIKTKIKNEKDYYQVIEIRISLPLGIRSNEKEKRILLEPEEEKELFWLIKVNSLDRRFIYTIPVLVYTQEISSEASFQIGQNFPFYSKEEMEKPIVEEEKHYLYHLDLNCSLDKKEVLVDEEFSVNCSVKNKGNTVIRNLNFCLENYCRNFDLDLNQEKEINQAFSSNQVGGHFILIQAFNQEIKKTEKLNYLVTDLPKIAIEEINYPKSNFYRERFNLSFLLKKKSFSLPEKVKISIKNQREIIFDLNELNDDKNFVLELVAINQEIPIKISWLDKKGNSYYLEEKIILEIKPRNLLDRILLFFKRIIEF